MKMTLRARTRIELYGTQAFPGFPGVAPEMAMIARWTARSGPRGRMPGWHICKFANGGKLCVHETSFRVVDNRS